MSDWFDRYGYAEIADGLLIGALPTDEADLTELRDAGVECVFNLCEDGEYATGERFAIEMALAVAGIEERRLATKDYGGLKPRMLEDSVGAVLAWLAEGRCVYLHCRAGWQRSPTVAAGVIALRDGIEPDEALRRIRLRKPSAQPLQHQLEDLHRWWRERGGSVSGGA